jgi:GAF domain/ANTAR domain
MSDLSDPAQRVRTVVATVLRDHVGEPDLLSRVCRACTELLTVDGMSISVMNDTDQREVLYASDEVSARVEALQFSLGEGPCFEAFHTCRPVLVPDLPAAIAPSWPAFAAEMAAEPVGAIFAFPLQSGAICIGAMDLYRRRPGWLSATELTTALAVVDVAVMVILNLLADAEHGDWWLDLPEQREQVHQAVGMLIAAFGIPADQALARLRGYAFAVGRLVDEVAHDIVTRRLTPNDLDR